MNSIRFAIPVATAFVATVGLFALVHCGSSAAEAMCGNGVVEDKEQCDKGEQNGVANSGCSASCTNTSINVAEVQVFASLFKDEVPGFKNGSCTAIGAETISIDLEGPSASNSMVPCTTASKLYPAVQPGTYQATVTLLDKQGAALTHAVQSMMVEVELGRMVTLSINFRQPDFIKQDYVGVLDFNPQWEEANHNCESASPSVSLEGVTLTTNKGAPVLGMTSTGRKLDGTFGPCFSASPTTGYERITNLPWGHYNLTLTGKIEGGVMGYCKMFDIFVAPGSTNATYALVVDPANADAGACP